MGFQLLIKYWILDPLKALIPHWFKSTYLGYTQARRVTFFDGELRVAGSEAQTHIPFSALTHPQSSEQLGELSGLVDIIVPHRAFLRRKITLPRKAVANASQIAALDLQEKTPFALTDVCWQISSPAPVSASAVSIEQWVARRTDLKQWKANLNEAGLSLRHVFIDTAEDLGPIESFHGVAEQRARLFQRVNAILVGLSILLLFWAWLYPTWVKKQELSELLKTRTALQTQAIALRQEADTQRETQIAKATFIEQLEQTPPFSNVLREVTVLTPDDTWLQTLSYRSAQLTFTGQTAGSSADLVLTLAKTPYFANPRLSGPVARSADGEKFEISMEVRVSQ
ncbi:PilN domain-containing protein [Celeribacter baekdonensis]|jgi:general secretion pathway protein L|uniref:PilN domain-containing protein n=1 Tax=Celeribacter baekdonensis TaxID=875171 RepID=UPI0030D72084|tara:strand:+ start:362770 stop:363789 length:1020 start_codon:yes stop_codon:yes gene_type:complete